MKKKFRVRCNYYGQMYEFYLSAYSEEQAKVLASKKISKKINTVDSRGVYFYFKNHANSISAKMA